MTATPLQFGWGMKQVLVFVLQVPETQLVPLVHSTQPFVAALQSGVAPPQLELIRQATHADVVPRSLHLGLFPVQAAQPDPQDASDLHTEQMPPLHSWFVPHDASVDA